MFSSSYLIRKGCIYDKHLEKGKWLIHTLTCFL